MAFQIFSYIILLFCLPSHIAQSHLYESSNITSSPLEFLSQLSTRVKKGENVKGVYKLKKYLSYLGYLTYNNDQSQEHENLFDDSLEIALRRYQEFYDLNITGFLDADTIAQMRQPRCDMPDLFTSNNKGLPFHKTSYYSFFPGNPKWTKKNLSYTFEWSVDKKVVQPLELALKEWASVTPFRFHYVTRLGKSDISFSFERGDHGDGHPFRRFCKIACAHSFPPPDGRVHFNAAVRWSFDHKRMSMDMQTVAVHELGHALGLHHSKVRKAIMYPSIEINTKKRIHQDDIDGINALYNLKGK